MASSMTTEELIKELRERADWCSFGPPKHADLFKLTANRLEVLSRAGGADLLRSVVDAWEVLPEGNYTPRKIEWWLRDRMLPAINKTRAMLSAAPPPPAPESPWRPIDTAPKDGTRILWCTDNGQYTASRFGYSIIRYPEDDEYFQVGWWQPLPAPPSPPPNEQEG